LWWNLAESQDDKFMALALKEARKGEFQTWPNPWVGAVVVRAGKVVGRGWHRGAGLPHAEIEALRMAGSKAKGATIYVSLEPCDHYGRTPPCTEAILSAGITRVVSACPDPHSKAKGGHAKLKKRGVKIGPWVRREEAARLNRYFLFSAAEGRPWFTLKAAATLDGRTATSRGESQWITGDAAREDARRLRGQCDAVLVGAGTVAQDQPGLLPLDTSGFVPWRLVLDPRGQLKGDESVFQDAHASRTVWFAGLSAFTHAVEAARRKGVHTESLHAGGLSGGVRSAMEWMQAHHLRRVMVEGGAATLGAFVRLGLADELVLYFAPKLAASGQGLPVFQAADELRLRDWPALHHMTAESVGSDLRINALFRPEASWAEVPAKKKAKR
jgi:diaminohydroxyphosphoribosylaminopyrimidine deaminase/5-amino-6-(5-phosphoribosylamino)uracil reductase